jgi:hypothetical protein
MGFAMLFTSGCLSRFGSEGDGQVVVNSTLESTNSVMPLAPSFHRVGALCVQYDEAESKQSGVGHHRLVVYDRNMREIASEVFDCHYGMNVDAVDLDGDSIPEFVLRLHLGPAVGPAIKELKVLRLNGDCLEEITSIPLAGQAGPEQGWWYDVEYEKSSGSGVTVRLDLCHDSLGKWVANLPKTRRYRIAIGPHETRIFSESDKTSEGTSLGKPTGFSELNKIFWLCS